MIPFYNENIYRHAFSNSQIIIFERSPVVYLKFPSFHFTSGGSRFDLKFTISCPKQVIANFDSKCTWIDGFRKNYCTNSK